MKRAPVHLRKTALAPSERARLPASVFVFPKERRFPIHDLFHGRLALIYVMSPSLSADREKVVKAVLARYPELRSFWESRTKSQRRPQRRVRGVAARPTRRTPTAAPARRRERRLSTNPSSEDTMPIYVVNPMHAMRSNPLAYDATPVIVVGKPQRRLIRARTPGKPGHYSKTARIASSETHALNPKTGAAFCGAGISRKTGKAAAGMIHPTNKNVVTCMRCIKVINLNDVDMSVPGVSRRRAIIERDLKPGSAKKREKHQMIRGGEQGRFVSGNSAHTSSRKAYRIYKERTAETGGPLYRGSEGIADFEKYVGWRGRPTQTIGEKRARIMAGQESAAARRRREAAEAAYAESGMAERVAAMGEYGPMEFEEREVLFEAGRRRASAAKGRRGAAAARREAAAAREAAVARGRRAVGGAEEYMDNPRRGRRGGKRAQAAGLKKGQSLMAKAAAAYRAGKYPTMQSALRGVARKSNPLSEDGMVVSNPSLRKTKKKSRKERKTKLTATQRAHMLEEMRGRLRARRAQQRAHASYAAEEYMDNPKRGRKSKKGGRTAAQSDAARAMSLFRSGRADSLAEAWAMVKRRA